MLDIKELLKNDEIVLEIAEEIAEKRAISRAGQTLARQLDRRLGPNPQRDTERLATASDDLLTLDALGRSIRNRLVPSRDFPRLTDHARYQRVAPG